MTIATNARADTGNATCSASARYGPCLPDCADVHGNRATAPMTPSAMARKMLEDSSRYAGEGPETVPAVAEMFAAARALPVAIDAMFGLVDAMWPAAADSFLQGDSHVPAEDIVLSTLWTLIVMVGRDGLARVGGRYILMHDALLAKSDCDQKEARKFAPYVRLSRAATAPGPWLTSRGY